MDNKFFRFIVESKKELVLFFCALFLVFSIMKLSTFIFIDLNSQDMQSVESNVITGYRLYIEDNDMGLVESYEAGDEIVALAKAATIESLGYDAELNPKVRIYEEELEASASIEPAELIIEKIKTVVIDSLDTIKIKAYAMKIGEDFVVALETKEEVKEVLANAQGLYVSSDTDVEIQLVSDPHNGLVESPRVLLKEAGDDRIMTANALNSGLQDEGEVEEVDNENSGTTVGIEFSEDVIIVETYVPEDMICSIESATEMITKENEEPHIYVVKSGDCLSTIAEENNMSVNQLYALNPVLKTQKYLQIGDELTVMVPEPELSVSTKEQVIYNTAIARKTTYVENSDKYVRSETILDYGADGKMEVTAILTKVNGKEIERTIINEEVILEPIDRVVEVGTKALPAKGSTGTYVTPLVSYIISSGFGPRWGGYHYGVDLAAPTGTSIRATDGGTIKYAGWQSGYGYLVIITHQNGVESRYAHCSSILVTVGQEVAQYEEIAKVGSTGNSTGPHLHFEIRFDGVPANPMDYLE